MGKFFNERTDILFMNPSHPRWYVKGKPKKLWVLLPMCAYKVSVPYPKGNNLNLFQETILKLFSSGARDDAWLAETMSLNISLIKFIVDELVNRGLITSRRTLTPEGMALLKEEDTTYEMMTGYVFYNYVTKTYMDTFISDKDFYIATVRKRKKDQVSFYSDDSIANPKLLNATIIHAENEELDVTPNAYDIIKICRKHKRRSQKLIQEDGDDKDDSRLPKNIEKVSLLGEKKYLYVATYLFLPTDDLVNRSKLQICYPFGTGLSITLIEAVTKLSSKDYNSALKNSIVELKKNAYSMTEKEVESVKNTHIDVDKEIRDILSINIEKYPYVHRKLIEVESVYVQIQVLKNQNKGNNRNYIQKRMNDYIIENYNLMAGVLIEVARANDYFRPDKLTNYPNQNAVILLSIAKQCGFCDEENNLIRFLSIRKGTIKSAYGTSKVDALLAYNLLIASEYNDHPFHRLARVVPQFITYLHKLVNLRNDAMHGNDIVYNFNLLEAYSIKNMYIASMVLDNLTFVNEREFDFDSERLVDKERLKVTKNAETQVEKDFTSNVINYSVVLKKLVALQEEVILKGDDYPSRTSEVFEAIFKILCNQRLVKNAVIELKDYRDKEAYQEYLLKMKKDGFDVDKIPYYSLSKLSKTFKNYHNGTLGTLFYAWYFSEKKRKDSILPEVSARIPELVKVISNIILSRKHNGKLDFFDSKLEYLKNTLNRCVNELIDIMTEKSIYLFLKDSN